MALHRTPHSHPHTAAPQYEPCARNSHAPVLLLMLRCSDGGRGGAVSICGGVLSPPTQLTLEWEHAFSQRLPISTAGFNCV